MDRQLQEEKKKWKLKQKKNTNLQGTPPHTQLKLEKMKRIKERKGKRVKARDRQ